MLYIVGPNTQELTNLLQAKRLCRFDGMHFYDKGQRLSFTKNDTIVCWGRCLPPMEPQRILNSSLTIHDYVDVVATIHATGRGGMYAPVVVKGSMNYANIPSMPHPLATIKPSSKLYNSRTFLSPDTFAGGHRREVAVTRINNEYEIHFFNNDVIYVRVKVPTLPIAHTEEGWAEDKKNLAHPWYKSTQTGWKTVLHEGQYMSLSKFDRSYVMDYARELVRQTNLLFCVVYIGTIQGSDYSFIRKITLAPELDSSLTKIYAERILEASERK